MQSKLTRRAVLAGVPAVAAVAAALPVIPTLAAPQPSPERKDPNRLWWEDDPTIIAWRADLERLSGGAL